MLHVIKRHLRLIIVWGVVFAILSGVVSLFFPHYYSAESQVLLISRSLTGVDPYTQSKAAERIGENLSKIMQTTDFYGKVMESNINFDKTIWQNKTERARRKDWQKNVQAEVVYGTGIVKVTVYAKDKNDVLAFSTAVTDALVTRGWEYVGGDVAIKMVSTPLVSTLPARPNYLVNVAVGLVLGWLLSGWWVVTYKRGVFGRG